MANRLATSDADILACYPVMVQLRPHHQADQFVETVHRMHATGFQLAMRTHEDRVMAVAGFRIIENLHTGLFGQTREIIRHGPLQLLLREKLLQVPGYFLELHLFPRNLFQHFDDVQADGGGDHVADPAW